jgi:hypothetical protein
MRLTFIYASLPDRSVREDGVTVRDQETVRMIAGNRFAKLLQGPGRRCMCDDLAMRDAPCPDLHQEEHIESLQSGGHYDQEIAGYDRLGVIANKRPPVLRRSPPVTSSLRFWRPIGAHCTSRNIDTQLTLSGTTPGLARTDQLKNFESNHTNFV